MGSSWILFRNITYVLWSCARVFPGLWWVFSWESFPVCHQSSTANQWLITNRWIYTDTHTQTNRATLTHTEKHATILTETPPHRATKAYLEEQSGQDWGQNICISIPYENGPLVNYLNEWKHSFSPTNELNGKLACEDTNCFGPDLCLFNLFVGACKCPEGGINREFKKGHALYSYR